MNRTREIIVHIRMQICIGLADGKHTRTYVTKIRMEKLIRSGRLLKVCASQYKLNMDNKETMNLYC